MLVHRRVTPSIKFAGTHLYSWVERGTVRVKCLAHEHNAMSPTRSRTRRARSGVERTNHEATVPPTIKQTRGTKIGSGNREFWKNLGLISSTITTFIYTEKKNRIIWRGYNHKQKLRYKYIQQREKLILQAIGSEEQKIPSLTGESKNRWVEERDFTVFYIFSLNNQFINNLASFFVFVKDKETLDAKASDLLSEKVRF